VRRLTWERQRLRGDGGSVRGLTVRWRRILKVVVRVVAGGAGATRTRTRRGLVAATSRTLGLVAGPFLALHDQPERK